MKRFLASVFIFSLFTSGIAAQSPLDTARVVAADTLLKKDSILIKDTILQDLPVSRMPDSLLHPKFSKEWGALPAAELQKELMNQNIYFNFSQPLTRPQVEKVRQVRGNDLLFYYLIFLLLTLGTLKSLFPKYFSDLFRLFFRTTLKQKQIREQLIQTPVPSLLLNVFFVLTAGLYACLLVKHFKLAPETEFWYLYMLSCAGLSAVYFIKFIGLKISGWIFNMQDAADSYIFIVFVINKMLGIFLMPFVLMLAYTDGNVYSFVFFLSFALIGVMLLYRFLLSFAAVKSQIKLSPFHFFIYLCAFEIAPLLIIYKGLLLFFNITA